MHELMKGHQGNRLHIKEENILRKILKTFDICSKITFFQFSHLSFDFSKKHTIFLC